MNIMQRLQVRFGRLLHARAEAHTWQASTRQCAFCSKIMPLDSLFCPQCGKQQEQLARETGEIASLAEIAVQVRRSAFEHAKRNALIWQEYQEEHVDLLETRVDIPIVQVERPFLAHVKKLHKQ